MNALEEIAILFAEDLKKYIEKGGSLEDLDANKVYELIDDDKSSNDKE